MLSKIKFWAVQIDSNDSRGTLWPIMPKQKKIKPLRKYINIFENLVKNEYKKKIAMTDIAFKKKIKGYWMEEFILNQELLELLSVSDCTFVKEYCKKKLFSEYVPLFFQCATYIKYYWYKKIYVNNFIHVLCVYKTIQNFHKILNKIKKISILKKKKLFYKIKFFKKINIFLKKKQNSSKVNILITKLLKKYQLISIRKKNYFRKNFQPLYLQFNKFLQKKYVKFLKKNIRYYVFLKKHLNYNVVFNFLFKMHNLPNFFFNFFNGFIFKNIAAYEKKYIFWKNKKIALVKNSKFLKYLKIRNIYMNRPMYHLGYHWRFLNNNSKFTITFNGEGIWWKSCKCLETDSGLKNKYSFDTLQMVMLEGFDFLDRVGGDHLKKFSKCSLFFSGHNRFRYKIYNFFLKNKWAISKIYDFTRLLAHNGVRHPKKRRLAHKKRPKLSYATGKKKRKQYKGLIRPKICKIYKKTSKLSYGNLRLIWYFVKQKIKKKLKKNYKYMKNKNIISLQFIKKIPYIFYQLPSMLKKKCIFIKKHYNNLLVFFYLKKKQNNLKKKMLLILQKKKLINIYIICLKYLKKKLKVLTKPSKYIYYNLLKQYRKLYYFFLFKKIIFIKNYFYKQILQKNMYLPYKFFLKKKKIETYQLIFKSTHLFYIHDFLIKFSKLYFLIFNVAAWRISKIKKISTLRSPINYSRSKQHFEFFLYSVALKLVFQKSSYLRKFILLWLKNIKLNQYMGTKKIKTIRISYKF